MKNQERCRHVRCRYRLKPQKIRQARPRDICDTASRDSTSDGHQSLEFVSRVPRASVLLPLALPIYIVYSMGNYMNPLK